MLTHIVKGERRRNRIEGRKSAKSCFKQDYEEADEVQPLRAEPISRLPVPLLQAPRLQEEWR